MIYGNHDVVKRNSKYLSKTYSSYYSECDKQHIPLFPGISIHEGLILEDSNTGNRIHLAHGHQGDPINDRYWKLGRFLVRYLWRPLELAGLKDPTSAAKNPDKKDITEKKLMHWVRTEHKMLIAGHTHRPVFPELGETLYFNDGSCVHPRCITALEITDGTISLVKWAVKTRTDRSLFVGKEVLAGPEKLSDYFKYEELCSS